MNILTQTEIKNLVTLAECPAVMVAVKTDQLKALLLEVIHSRLKLPPLRGVPPVSMALKEKEVATMLADESLNYDHR